MTFLDPRQRDRLKRAIPAVNWLRQWQHRMGRGNRIRQILAATRDPALNLGCGGHALPGWLNTDLQASRSDIIPLDATKRLPFVDGIFHFAFSEHMIEHVPLVATQFLFGELFRVVRPGGLVRMATPNLRTVTSVYGNSQEPIHAAYIKWSLPLHSAGRLGNPACQVLNSLFYAHGHRFLFDAETLSAYLVAAGFVDCVQCHPGESSHSRLRGIEGHGSVIGDQFNHLETLIIEARRP